MAQPKPRIIVSRATFDTDPSVEGLRSSTSTDTFCSERSRDIRQAPAASSVKHTPRQTWLQSASPWALELVWCLLSVVLLMGLVMVLSTYDKQRLPEIPLGITLNTIVAILATATRAVTVFLIGQGISQLKWNQYVGGHKPLTNLQVFDEASRGPWGSLQMVFRTRANLLALLASFLIITSLASSTLTQSAIAYIPRLVPEESLVAKVQYCNSYPCGPAINLGTDFESDVVNFNNRFETAAFGAVFNPIDRKWPALEPRCQSADCRWPRFNTLAVCLEMRNVTDQIDISEEIGEDNGQEVHRNKASLLNGTVTIEETTTFGRGDLAINITAIGKDFLPVGSERTNETFPSPRASIAFDSDDDLLRSAFSQLLVLYNNPNVDINRPKVRYRAAVILMHFCVRTLEVEVKQGQSSINSVKSYTRITDSQSATVSITGKGAEGFYELSSEDGKDKFRVLEHVGFNEIDENFGRAFSGYYTGHYAGLLRVEQRQGALTRQLGINMFQDVKALRVDVPNTPPEEVDQKVWKNLGQALSTIGTSVTNYMRESGLEKDGTALTSVTFVQVRWEWLTLVAAQVVLSIVFVLVVIIRTAGLGVDVVKSSNMAELFALSAVESMDPRTRVEQGTGHRDFVYSGINTEVGKEVGATLTKGSEGWRLVLKQKEDYV
ncbi:hypothetical protein NLU13_1154 [Sarocladium strictum]|uniref:Uncharacterized protein n=1 Tax=Sarocladium strictum TaxID=5046 RepID=A0AA39LC37_SARSR|nr:hypothetical protein NLU13_1154 [Sarocladium strictum]